MQKQSNNHYLNSATDHLDDELYDLLLYQLNFALYFYGDHFKVKRKTLKSRLKDFIRSLFFSLYRVKFLWPVTFSLKEKIVLSNAYVDVRVRGIKSVLPPWRVSISRPVLSSWKLSAIVTQINKVLEKNSMRVLLSEEFLSLINSYEYEFAKLLKNKSVTCLIVPNDMAFFENLSIKVAKKHKVPTFVYLHGLPGRYNHIDDNRAEYLIVWGKGLKDAYVKAGFPPDKIIVLKHPEYGYFSNVPLRSSFQNILVLSKAVSGAPSSSTEVNLSDRSKSLHYLELVKKILKELGVRSARLRLHPSESPSFYSGNLIDDFYTIDGQDKISSLGCSTLVVGPTSTMLLDSIKSGVNYILFDPIVDGRTLDGAPTLVEPCDGSSFIRVSKDVFDFKCNSEHPDKNIDIQVLNDFFRLDEADINRFLKIVS